MALSVVLVLRWSGAQQRLSISDHARQMILKGGMLMAASQIRQMTKDADLSTHGIAGDEKRVREIVAQIERMSYLSPPPEQWAELIDGVIEFVDPLLADDGRLSRWDPEALTWG